MLKRLCIFYCVQDLTTRRLAILMHGFIAYQTCLWYSNCWKVAWARNNPPSLRMVCRRTIVPYYKVYTNSTFSLSVRSSHLSPGSALSSCTTKPR